MVTVIWIHLQHSQIHWWLHTASESHRMCTCIIYWCLYSCKNVKFRDLFLLSPTFLLPPGRALTITRKIGIFMLLTFEYWLQNHSKDLKVWSRPLGLVSVCPFSVHTAAVAMALLNCNWQELLSMETRRYAASSAISWGTIKPPRLSLCCWWLYGGEGKRTACDVAMMSFLFYIVNTDTK